MELRIKLHDKNNYPLGGILVKGSSIAHWVRQIQGMGLCLANVSTYPIPDTTPNSIWGCFVVYNVEKTKIDIGKNSYCQSINHILYIPEKTVLYPSLTQAEISKLFLGKPHLLHPEFGLVELIEAISWEAHIARNQFVSIQSRQPAPSVFIPKQIKSFQVKSVPADEVLKNLEEKTFPKQEKLEDNPLNPFEEAKLLFYRQLFEKKEAEKTEKTDLLSTLESIKNLFSPRQDNQWTKEMQEEYEELERRNQSQIEKLLDLLKKNPQEALKYAIPLDSKGTNRGGNNARLDISKMWTDFSLFSNAPASSGSGSSTIQDQHFQQLEAQYYTIAQELIKEKDYLKAAFIYMKLLKNYHLAAKTLEEGRLYQEAASIYAKFLNNKEKAAECYEKGNMTTEAIELYKELNKNEKVGDLYISINKKKEAFAHYEKVIDEYRSKHQYLKASLLYKNKMEDEQGGQNMLLEGWRANQDAFNCLNNYFSNIKDTKSLGVEIQRIYADETNEKNKGVFLQVIKYEYDKQNELAASVRDMAYEIISVRMLNNPATVSELLNFNKSDKRLVKDTIRYKLSQK